MKDRHNLHLFYSGEKSDSDVLTVQEITEEIYSAKKISIVNLAVDFTSKSPKQKKEIENKWFDLLPKLDSVKSLSIGHRVNQDFFEALCKMGNLETLHFRTSTTEDISSISKLQNLKRLDIDRFSKLKDISPLLTLKKLQLLSIENSFNIANYELIGQMTDLKGLCLGGDTFAPKNLRLNSLTPFNKLKKLKHLDLSSASVIDNSYEIILELENLERFDTTATIPKQIRELIKNKHKNLKAGFFMDWDYENKKIYDDKEW